MLQDRVSDSTFIRCKHPDCFSILHVRKYALTCYFWCFWCPCYALVVTSNRLNQFFNFSLVTYMGAQVKSSIIANICWLIQTFKYQCCAFQVHFKSILVYNLKTKSDFWSKCPHYIIGYMITLGSMFFPFSLVLNFGIFWLFIMPNLKCIHAVFALLWPFQ